MQLQGKQFTLNASFIACTYKNSKYNLKGKINNRS